MLPSTLSITDTFQLVQAGAVRLTPDGGFHAVEKGIVLGDEQS